MCIASAVLHADESETFERHGIGFALFPCDSDHMFVVFVGDKIGEGQRNDVAARAVNDNAALIVSQ